MCIRDRYSLKYGYDAFVRAGMRFERILLTGGGANSAAWRQMVADVFALPVEAPQQSEGAALGAALQALWALGNAQGEKTTLRELADLHVTTDPQLAATPDPERVAAYRASYQHFLQHLQAVTPLYRG